MCSVYEPNWLRWSLKVPFWHWRERVDFALILQTVLISTNNRNHRFSKLQSRFVYEDIELDDFSWIFALEMDVWNITVSGQLVLLSWWRWLAEVLFLGGRFLNGGSVCSLGGNLSLCYGCGRFSLVAPVCVWTLTFSLVVSSCRHGETRDGWVVAIASCCQTLRRPWSDHGYHGGWWTACWDEWCYQAS